MSDSVAELSADEVLTAATEGVRVRRVAEVRELELLLQWADLHSTDEAQGSRCLIQLGGDGTPRVQEWCLAEIALARSAGLVATMNLLADALDLRHRLPLLWRQLCSGHGEVWVARKVARCSRVLAADQTWIVDQAIAPMLGTQAPGRVIETAEAKVIEADPQAHQARVEAEQQRRYVSLGRTDEHGLRTLIARLNAGDAVWVDATVTQVAGILRGRHPEADTGELRALALGYLARPAELLALLAANTTTEGVLDLDLPHDPWDQTGEDPAEEPAADCVGGTNSRSDTSRGEPHRRRTGDHDAHHDAHHDNGDATGAGRGQGHDLASASGLSRAVAFPTDLLNRLQAIDWTVLAPKRTLYVHLHEAALHGTPGVARVEGLCPQTLAQLQGLLAGARVAVKPVIDLHQRIRSTAYEHPEALKERVYLITGGDYWPWATSTSRHVDYDHVTPWPRDSRPPDNDTGPLEDPHDTGPPDDDGGGGTRPPPGPPRPPGPPGSGASPSTDSPRLDTPPRPSAALDDPGERAAGDRQATPVAGGRDNATGSRPAGWTGTDNSGPLGRRHHRQKTFSGIRVRQSGAGRYILTTRHKRSYLVDHHGTRAIPYPQAAAIRDAPPGVDLYPAPFYLDTSSWQ